MASGPFKEVARREDGLVPFCFPAEELFLQGDFLCGSGCFPPELQGGSKGMEICVAMAVFWKRRINKRVMIQRQI